MACAVAWRRQPAAARALRHSAAPAALIPVGCRGVAGSNSLLPLCSANKQTQALIYSASILATILLFIAYLASKLAIKPEPSNIVASILAT